MKNFCNRNYTSKARDLRISFWTTIREDILCVCVLEMRLRCFLYQPLGGTILSQVCQRLLPLQARQMSQTLVDPQEPVQSLPELVEISKDPQKWSRMPSPEPISQKCFKIPKMGQDSQKLFRTPSPQAQKCFKILKISQDSQTLPRAPSPRSVYPNK